MEKRIKLIFFGTPDFAVDVLQEMEAQERVPMAVVCQPDRPKGRGRKMIPPPVKLWAQQRSIQVFQPSSQKDPEYMQKLSSMNAHLAVVAAFGQILPKILLDIPTMGFINVHPSLIPRYRGAAPIQWSLINGDKHTGLSILKVTPRLDDGEILRQQQVDIDQQETAPELAKRLAHIGGKLCSEVISAYEKNHGPISGTTQDENLVTWAPQLDKSLGDIDWKQSATKIHNLVRGVQPWPGARTSLRSKPLKIHRTSLSKHEPAQKARIGEVIEAAGDSMLVQTGKGVLALLEVQAAGKKKMPVRAFLSGQKIVPGEIMG